MKLNNVHHIAVNTLDIETSIAFYRDMFGFEEEKRADMGNCILVYLKISPDSYMELFDLKGDCESGSIPENLQGLRHIAFDVQDIEAWNQHLKKKNAEFVMDLCEMPSINKKGLLIRGPNGTVIELCENINGNSIGN